MQTNESAHHIYNSIEEEYNDMLDHIDLIFDHKRFLDLFSRCTRITTIDAFNWIKSKSKRDQDEFMDRLEIRRHNQRVNKVMNF